MKTIFLRHFVVMGRKEMGWYPKGERVKWESKRIFTKIEITAYLYVNENDYSRGERWYREEDCWSKRPGWTRARGRGGASSSIMMGGKQNRGTDAGRRVSVASRSSWKQTRRWADEDEDEDEDEVGFRRRAGARPEEVRPVGLLGSTTSLVNCAAFALCCCPSVEGPRISQPCASHTFSRPLHKAPGKLVRVTLRYKRLNTHMSKEQGKKYN